MTTPHVVAEEPPSPTPTEVNDRVRKVINRLMRSLEISREQLGMATGINLTTLQRRLGPRSLRGDYMFLLWEIDAIVRYLSGVAHQEIKLDDVVGGTVSIRIDGLPRQDSDLEPAVYQHITRTIHPAHKRHLSIVGAPTRGGSDERGSATALSRTA